MKKTFWENRLIAWAVLAACVLFSLSFSGGRALGNLRSETEHIFYQGVNNDGLSIDRDLAKRAECAYNLAGVAANYPAIDKALTEKAREVSNQLSSATGIPEKYQANLSCQQAVEDLYSAMENAALSANDHTYAYKEYKEFQSRADTISRDFYNERALQFNNTLSAFPAGLIGRLSGVRTLELFGNA